MHLGEGFSGNGSLKLICIECKLTFPCWGSFNTHIKTRHNNEGQTHAQCSLKFESNSAITKYLSHKRPQCPSTFYKNSDLRKHLLTHSVEPNTDRTSLGCLEQHTKTEEYHTCPQCSLKLVSKSCLEKHLHLKCTECPSAFCKKGDLRRHLLTHSVKCYVCGKAFSSTGYLKKHLVQMHGKPTKHYKCKVCSYSIDQLYRLRNHMSVHIADPNYRGNLLFGCISCSAEFETESSLLYHALVIHKNPGLRRCKWCGIVKKRGSFRDHLKKCDELNKNTSKLCIICNNQFESYDTMIAHIKGNQGNAAYEAYHNFLLGKLSSKSELDLLGKLTSFQQESVINSLSQGTRRTHIIV